MPPRRSPSPRLARARTAWALALGLASAPGLVAAAPPLSAGDVRKDMNAPTDIALEDDGGGRLRHRGDGFTAIIHRDGSVEFRDHGGAADISFFGFDLRRQRFRRPEPDRHDPAWSAALDRATFPLGQAPQMLGFGARFGGLADGRRKDRHRSAKRAFLAATEALRFRLAHAWYKDRLQHELADLGSQLAEVWRDATLPLDERKRRIFERWADCEERTTSRLTELDSMRLEVARTARAKIEAFVRQVAPYGSPQAYTDAELDRLNAGRAGKARFRPYDAPVLPEDVLAEAELGTSPKPAPARGPTTSAPPRSAGPENMSK